MLTDLYPQSANKKLDTLSHVESPLKLYVKQVQSNEVANSNAAAMSALDTYLTYSPSSLCSQDLSDKSASDICEKTGAGLWSR